MIRTNFYNIGAYARFPPRNKGNLFYARLTKMFDSSANIHPFSSFKQVLHCHLRLHNTTMQIVCNSIGGDECMTQGLVCLGDFAK